MQQETPEEVQAFAKELHELLQKHKVQIAVECEIYESKLIISVGNKRAEWNLSFDEIGANLLGYMRWQTRKE